MNSEKPSLLLICTAGLLLGGWSVICALIYFAVQAVKFYLGVQ